MDALIQMCAYINKRSFRSSFRLLRFLFLVLVLVLVLALVKLLLLCRPLFDMQDFVINIQLKGFPTQGCQDAGGVAFAKCEGGAKSFPLAPPCFCFSFFSPLPSENWWIYWPCHAHTTPMPSTPPIFFLCQRLWLIYGWYWWARRESKRGRKLSSWETSIWLGFSGCSFFRGGGKLGTVLLQSSGSQLFPVSKLIYF